MNTIQTQDGYTKVRTHDFDAMEKELSELRSSLIEAQEHIAELETQLENALARDNHAQIITQQKNALDNLKAQNEKMREALNSIVNTEFGMDFDCVVIQDGKKFTELRNRVMFILNILK